MFMRAVADLDGPHIRVLQLMAREKPGAGQQSGSPFHTASFSYREGDPHNADRSSGAPLPTRSPARW